MAKCNGCGKFISPSDAVKCDKCKLIYHRGCVCLPAKISISTPWHCPECKKNVVRDNSADTPVRGRTQDMHDCSPDDILSVSPSRASKVATDREILFDIKAEFEHLKEDFFNELRAEFQMLRDDIVNLRSSLQSCKEFMGSLEERVIILENQVKSQPASTIDFDNNIAQLRVELNERDQELLSNDVEITNLPEYSGENPIHLAVLVATKIGIKLDSRDVVSAERVGLRYVNAKSSAGPEEGRPRRIVVRLARRDLRDEMLRCARVRRGATTSDLDMAGPPRRFYINERLTKLNRQLFRKVRDAGERFKWKYVWTKHGHILARKNPSDRAHRIRTEADISQIFGSTNGSP